MNEKEQLVLQTIKSNPFLSQQEMAEVLNIPRPTLANIISGLIKKGEIIGRAYVLPERNSIFAIGGANVDRKFHIDGSVQHGTSNPSTVTESVGGVARNVAENLGRFGNDVKLITLIGQDHGAKVIENESHAFINFDYVEELPDLKTGSYSAVLDRKGELILAMADMSIYDYLLPPVLIKHEAALSNAKCIIIDLNCPKETVEYLQNLASIREIPLAIVPVSAPKMKNMPKDLSGVAYFIVNRDEVESYLNIQMKNKEDYSNAVSTLLEMGAKNVILTLGEQGAMAGNKDGIHHFEAEKTQEIIDVTGAGDAFVAGFMHAVLNEESFIDAVNFGQYNASKTLQSNKTVRQDITAEELNNWRNK
ncbi:winged helix-turn-helix transcriptional regulator [Lysinibacillus yapensis]|uniref:Winged helix-turn-helix transcriptional regulator n=1 Tax=Ureibacillus yapensis TaxID=2304605 RepID=A0A396S8R1_9BACL|nr:PfkB family carbohydrate kinase [Lysinibacillus yapensis]RHW34748.1 winged helix-turn-helix transcriptional regulator [Lysinibacillus yapensis]